MCKMFSPSDRVVRSTRVFVDGDEWVEPWSSEGNGPSMVRVLGCRSEGNRVLNSDADRSVVRPRCSTLALVDVIKHGQYRSTKVARDIQKRSR